MIEQIRKGEDGEVTFEIFQAWFPDKPEILLMDFINSELEELAFMIPIGDDKFIISRITKDYAQRLLDER